MKNSVWHYKFWKTKLNELPVETDLNAEWSEMQSILDKELPLINLPKSESISKTFASKIISMLGYILPVAAMLAGITYFAIKQPEKEKPLIIKKINKNSLLKIPDTLQSKATIKSENTLISTPEFSVINRDYHVSNSTNIDGIKDEPMADPTKSFVESQNTNSNEIAGPSTITSSEKNTGGNRNLSYDETEDAEKIKADKNKSVKKPKNQSEIYTPPYNYGFEAGLNIHEASQNIFLGATAAYAINKRLLINAGLRISFANTMEGSYKHPNYNLKDSASKENLTILDQRKLTTADIPLGLEYKISNRISVKAGPVISLLLINGGTGSRLSSVKNPLDTMFNSKKINTALGSSSINKFSIGFSGGLNVRFKQFNIEAGYRQNFTPYKVNSDLGSYEKEFKTFQIGIGYNFK
nr:outer membrane beta-barrel protein [Pedobacter panaciterrae]